MTRIQSCRRYATRKTQIEWNLLRPLRLIFTKNPTFRTFSACASLRSRRPPELLRERETFLDHFTFSQISQEKQFFYTEWIFLTPEKLLSFLGHFTFFSNFIWIWKDADYIIWIWKVVVVRLSNCARRRLYYGKARIQNSRYWLVSASDDVTPEAWPNRRLFSNSNEITEKSKMAEEREKFLGREFFRREFPAQNFGGGVIQYRWRRIPVTAAGFVSVKDLFGKKKFFFVLLWNFRKI